MQTYTIVSCYMGKLKTNNLNEAVRFLQKDIELQKKELTAKEEFGKLLGKYLPSSKEEMLKLKYLGR